MKRYLNNHCTARRLMTLTTLTVGLALPLPSPAGHIKLATEPLAHATSTVLPNLMFILDNSGSMDWNYLPDWANDSICKDTSGTYTYNCSNQPPFQSADFNGVYYNPAINYVPAVNFDGTSKASMTSVNTGAMITPPYTGGWTIVKDDAYNIQRTTSTNLITSFPDYEWCTSTAYTDCLRNDNYVLPGTVNGKNYTTKHTVTSTGSGFVATGNPDAATTAARTWGPHYYTIIPGEYCDTPGLTSCQGTPTLVYKYPAKLRWCNSASAAMAASTPSATGCKKTYSSVYKYPRYPTVFSSGGSPAIPATPAVPASASFTISMAGCTSTKTAGISEVWVNGVNIVTSTGNRQKTSNALASDISGRIGGGYTGSVNGSTVTITAPVASGAINYAVTLTRDPASNGACVITYTPSPPLFSGYTPATPGSPAVLASYTGNFIRTDIVPGNNSYPYPGTTTKAASRTDCAGTTCTYAEEMTNFANWWTYYQTRMQAMKTAASRAFKSIDQRYRVGFITITSQSTYYLPIARFDAGVGNQKDLWYTKLFSINPSQSTPLRSALSIVGRIFAGKKPVGTADPIEYSCQQNFAMLTTDGYWNTDSASNVLTISGAQMGDMDGGTTPRPMYEGPSGWVSSTGATLADVAKYYFDTDLRTVGLGNCTGALGAGVDVCENNVFTTNSDNNTKQHMTTFTMGLGVDGILSYSSDYKTATSGDYYNLKNGLGSPTVNWPVAVENTETAVDDLWHAAVNGNGTYFSAKDPAQMANGLDEALANISSKLGAGAAAATSTLNPVSGDNYAYVASYTTVKWQGNLEARTINITTGAVSKDAAWCAEDIVAGSCSSPSTVVADSSGSSNVYYCVTSGATAATCPAPGILVGTDCKVQIATACTGTMLPRVAASSDTRTILMNVGGILQDFNYYNLGVAGKSSYFDSAYLSTRLSQWPSFTAAQQATASGSNLVAYLRGQYGYDERPSNAFVNQLYRTREAVLGDAVESKPAFIAKPTFSYTDPGYDGFIAAQASRPGTVYIGTNDGMLHAFNATDGQERWAFVPTQVIPNLWKLADKSYSTMHANYVNGSPVISDICTASCSTSGAVWKTILVGGLNGGGREYYALDITDPTAPVFLWEFTPANDANLGYTFGNPVITKLKNGTWVVLVTSGYDNGTLSGDGVTNNSPAGDGKGYLYVLNAATGAQQVAKIPTNIGTAASPSGLARIASWADDAQVDNTATYTYGGDLQGNVWRFDINGAIVSGFNPLKLASLYADAAGFSPQPITTKPELGLINKKRVVLVGTGKYLETSDLSDTQQQTLYNIMDDNATTTLVNPRNSLVQQTLTVSAASSAVRIASNNPVDFTQVRGCYVNLPDSKERQNVDAQLVYGTWLVPTTVPSNSICSPGGYSWLNFLDYQTCGALDSSGTASAKTNAPIVGVNVLYIPKDPTCVGSGCERKPVASVVTADNPTPDLVSGAKFYSSSSSSSGFQQRKVIWRELIQ